MAFVLAAVTAKAAPQGQPEAMHLLLPPCATLPFDAARLTELLRLELDAIGVRRLEVSAALEPSDEVPAWVVLTLPNCSPAAEDVTLGLLDTKTGKRANADMHIADLPLGLRSRAIAIRIVELVRSGWPELSTPAAPSASKEVASAATSRTDATSVEQPMAAAPASPPSAPVSAGRLSAAIERGVPAHREGWSTRVEGEFAAAAFPSRSTGLVGPLGAVAFVRDAFRISAGAQGLFGRATAAAGAADIGWVSGYLGAGVAGKFVVLEPRVLLGYAWASSTASDTTKVVSHDSGGFTAIVALAGGVRGAVDRIFDVAVDISAGYALGGVSFTADEARFAGVSGALIGAAIGVSLRP